MANQLLHHPDKDDGRNKAKRNTCARLYWSQFVARETCLFLLATPLWKTYSVQRQMFTNIAV